MPFPTHHLSKRQCFLCPGRLVGAEEEPGLVSGISAGAEKIQEHPCSRVHGVSAVLVLTWQPCHGEQGLQTMPHNDWMGICSS